MRESPKQRMRRVGFGLAEGEVEVVGGEERGLERRAPVRVGGVAMVGLTRLVGQGKDGETVGLVARCRGLVTCC